jgi:monoterpene epsilon-lactone hydrolase
MPSLQHAIATQVVPRLRRNPPTGDLVALRANLVERNRTAEESPPDGVGHTHEVQISNDRGFPVFTLWKPGGRGGIQDSPTRTVVYVHGGAYVRGMSTWHWKFVARLADELGAGAVLPAYPVAPESSVEDSFEEMVAIVQQAIAESPDGVVLAGDSAGGGYALALAQAVRDRGGPQPSHLVLIAPWVDLTGSAPGTREAAARDPWLSFEHLSIYAGFWAGSDDPEALADPRVSPGLADLAGLPPALMLCGTRDLLQPGCDALFERAEAADWSLEYVVAPGLMHVYPLLPIPEARAAFEHIAEFCTPET